GLLAIAARWLWRLLGVSACTRSRVLGVRLVDLVEHHHSGRQDRLGHGCLVSDYPLTRAVIEEREPRTVFLDDPEADAAEAELLRELGFGSLLMVAIEAGGEIGRAHV